MQVYEQVYEETYGGNHNFHKNVTDFEEFEIVNIRVENGSKIINATPVGYICQHEWKITEISKEEFEQLKMISGKSILNKVGDIQSKITQIETSFPILFKEIEVKYSFDFSDNNYWNNSYIREYILKSPNCQKGEFYQKTTLLNLLLQYSIHKNNYTDWKLFKNHYVGINGKMDILDEEVCNFISNITYGSKEYDMFNLIGLFQLRTTYSQMFREITLIQY